MLTETADREYRARFLLNGRPPAQEEATSFPNPDSRIGALDHGTAKSHMYNPADVSDQKNVVLGKRINGWNRAGYIAVTDMVTNDYDKRDLFFQTLRHEVQHDADKHRGPELSHAVDTAQPGPGKEFQKALREYKTEYRAHSYQGGPALTVPPDANRRGRQWAQGQFEVFEQHGANTKTLWSRPLRKDHHHNHVTGLRLSGDRRAGAAQAVDTVRKSAAARPQPGMVLVLTVHVPAISPPASLSVMPEALRSS